MYSIPRETLTSRQPHYSRTYTKPRPLHPLLSRISGCTLLPLSQTLTAFVQRIAPRDLPDIRSNTSGAPFDHRLDAQPRQLTNPCLGMLPQPLVDVALLAHLAARLRPAEERFGQRGAETEDHCAFYCAVAASPAGVLHRYVPTARAAPQRGVHTKDGVPASHLEYLRAPPDELRRAHSTQNRVGLMAANLGLRGTARSARKREQLEQARRSLGPVGPRRALGPGEVISRVLHDHDRQRRADLYVAKAQGRGRSGAGRVRRADRVRSK